MHHFSLQPFSSLSSSELDILESHQVTYEFFEEVRYRQEFETYCEWYYTVAEQHQHEAESMKNDINILGWFCRQ